MPLISVLPVESPPDPYAARPEPVGADAYFAIGIGLLLFLLFPRILKFLSHKLFGTAWAPYLLPNGTEVSYLTQNDFKSDLGIALFGAALVLDGIILVVASRSRTAALVAAGVMAVATIVNAFIVVTLMSGGLPVVSTVAVLFGGYGTMVLWQKSKAL